MTSVINHYNQYFTMFKNPVAMLHGEKVNRASLPGVPIPKPHLESLFGISRDYQFPSLIFNHEGIPTGECIKYTKFDEFTIDTTSNYPIFNVEDGDIDNEILKFIMENKIEKMGITLNNDINPDGTASDYATHSSYVFPEVIKHCPAVYDTIKYTDDILKYTYKILMMILTTDMTINEIKEQINLIGYRAIDGVFYVNNLENIYSFGKLLNTMKMFIVKNKLHHKEKKKEIVESYFAFREKMTSGSRLSVSIAYDDITYSCQKEDEKYHILIHPLKQKLVFTYRNGETEEELPEYLKYEKQFYDEHYEDIKKAFPIYERLENIYRLMACVKISNLIKEGLLLENFSIPKSESETLYFVDKYPHSIMCTGGIELTPTNFIRIPFKEHPLVKATQKNIDHKACRKAFDNGGLICAFAPKLKIRECYDKNLKDFHDCLAE